MDTKSIRHPEPPITVGISPWPAPPTYWAKSVDIFELFDEIKAAADQHRVTFQIQERRRVFVGTNGSILSYTSTGTDATDMFVTRDRPSKTRTP